MEIVPISQLEAFNFINRHHRHHKSLRISIFQVAVSDGEKIVGVAVCARPVNRHEDNGFTIEISRCCTDGTPNACSMLYAACWRTARSMGYKRIITYILKEEKGTSLYASNFRLIGECGGGTWNRKLRPRVDKSPTCLKLKFEYP
jgi:hypothetical protein